MVVKIDGGGFSEPKPAPKNTSEQAPAPKQRLILDGRKPPLVFPGVTLPEPSITDPEWGKKFDNYAARKKDKKCARMLKEALETNQFWRIAHALETRHQAPDPDSVFSLNTKIAATYQELGDVLFGITDTLYSYIRDCDVSDQAKEMIINGLYPSKDDILTFETLAGFHRDTLMTWAGYANRDLLNRIFLATIYTGQAEDIVKLTEMGADINCSNYRPVIDYRTPLRCAISRQDNTILQQIIDLGANIFAEFDHLMEQAYQYGNLDIVKTLKDMRETQETNAGLQSKTQTSNTTDGWTALSATFAEFSRPKGATGLQVTYQFDFEAKSVNCIYEKDNAISAPTIIPLYQMTNPALVQKAADVIEQKGYPRPDTEHVISHSPGARKITSVNRSAPGR